MIGVMAGNVGLRGSIAGTGPGKRPSRALLPHNQKRRPH